MIISVVVPTFNRREIVLRSVSTLLRQDFPSTEYEIIVVVDGSIDGTVAALKSLKPLCHFRVIEQENRGLAGARNTGYRAAEADLVLFLDDDMRCDPGLVAAHVAAHTQSDQTVGFGALFLSEDSRPSLASECFNREIGAFHLRQKRDPAALWQISDCVFSNASLPRRMLIDAGGFDEAFRMREDLELGVRLFAAGACPRYISDAIAYQYYDKTIADLLVDAEAFAVADVQFVHKHPEAQSQGQLKLLANEPLWKKKMRRLLVGSPAIEKCLLAPLCSLGQKLFYIPVFRNIGVRSLQIRRALHWTRVVWTLTIP